MPKGRTGNNNEVMCGCVDDMNSKFFTCLLGDGDRVRQLFFFFRHCFIRAYLLRYVGDLNKKSWTLLLELENQCTPTAMAVLKNKNQIVIGNCTVAGTDFRLFDANSGRPLTAYNIAGSKPGFSLHLRI